MAAKGIAPRKIAEQLNICLPTINKYCKKFKIETLHEVKDIKQRVRAKFAKEQIILSNDEVTEDDIK